MNQWEFVSCVAQVERTGNFTQGDEGLFKGCNLEW